MSSTRSPQLFSYVITHDIGFAPNPFGGVLTLATCKPRIRQTARQGDWLLGTGSVAGVGAGHVVYAARVAEVLSLEAYGEDSRFPMKIPSVHGEPWRRHGDNIYMQNPDGGWVQRRNPYHDNADLKRDLGGRNVLVCERFWYFGGEAPSLPPELRSLVKQGPGHRSDATREQMQALEAWLLGFPLGVRAAPGLVLGKGSSDFVEMDESINVDDGASRSPLGCGRAAPPVQVPSTRRCSSR